MITRAKKFFNKLYKLEDTLKNIRDNYKDFRGELAEKVVKDLARYYLGDVKTIKSEAKVLTTGNNPLISYSKNIRKTFGFGKGLEAVKIFINEHEKTS